MRAVAAYRPAVLVAALGTAFGALLIITAGVITRAMRNTGLDQVGAVGIAVTVVTVVFMAISIYVGAVVTANTCAAVIAGRTRTIALQRLIGATAERLRADITRDGIVVGLVGGVAGLGAGIGLAAAALGLLRSGELLPGGGYQVLPPALLLPFIAVVLSTWGSFRAGSRDVLAVTPLQALGAGLDEARAHGGPGRRRRAVVLLAVGVGVMVLAVVSAQALGALSMLLAVVGACLTFSGIVAGSTFVVPPLLALIARIGSRDPVVLLAGRNALRSPARAAGATIGLVIGVTLLITFAVALGSFGHALEQFVATKGQLEQTRSLLGQVGAVVNGIVGYSSVIAAVGVVNALSIGVLQRRREFGLLRVLGFTAAQTRRMIVTEALQMVATAVVAGLVLGTVFGWLGAYTLLSAVHPFAILPVLPPVTVVLVVVGAVVLAVLASVAPVRRVMRVAPTVALAE